MEDNSVNKELVYLLEINDDKDDSSNKKYIHIYRAKQKIIYNL
jgi:hypothetical protein